MRQSFKYSQFILFVLCMGSNCHHNHAGPQSFEPVGSFEEELTKCKKMRQLSEHCQNYILRKSQLKCQQDISAIRLSCFRQAVNAPNSDEFFKTCTHHHAASVQDCQVNDDTSDSYSEFDFVYHADCYLVSRASQHGVKTLKTYKLGPANTEDSEFPCFQYAKKKIPREQFSEPDDELKAAILKKSPQKAHP